MKNTILPENFLKLISPEDRASLGPAGMTAAEASAKAERTNERKLQGQIASYLGLHQIPYFWTRTDKRTTALPGTPDFICCIDGKFVAFEVKTHEGKATPEQVLMMQAIDKANGFAIVVRSLDEVRNAISRLNHTFGWSTLPPCQITG